VWSLYVPQCTFGWLYPRTTGKFGLGDRLLETKTVKLLGVSTQRDSCGGLHSHASATDMSQCYLYLIVKRTAKSI